MPFCEKRQLTLSSSCCTYYSVSYRLLAGAEILVLLVAFLWGCFGGSKPFDDTPPGGAQRWSGVAVEGKAGISGVRVGSARWWALAYTLPSLFTGGLLISLSLQTRDW